MNPSAEAAAHPSMDRLVAALVDWGGTASQIVSHMEHTKRSGASTASRSVVEVFGGLLAQTIAPELAGRDDEVRRAAALLEQVDRIVREEIYIMPLTPPRRTAGGRRRPG